jgi:uncharacterized iron-regulated membrane protein
MNEREAIELAAEFARARGRDAGLYAAEAERERGVWRVDFRPGGEDAKPSPGDFFTVYVDDKSGKVRGMEDGK